MRDPPVRPVPRMAWGKRRQHNGVAVVAENCTQLLQHRIRTKAISGVSGQDEFCDLREALLQQRDTRFLARRIQELSEEVDPRLPILFGFADTGPLVEEKS